MSIEHRATIRRVEAGDLDHAAALLAKFYLEEQIATPPATIRARLPLLAADDGCAILLAWVAEHAAGVATVKTSLGVEFGRSAELDDLFVLPEYRGHGVGQQLIAAIEAWCSGEQITTLTLVVTPAGQAAHDLVSFYGKRGFEDTGRRVLNKQLQAEQC